MALSERWETSSGTKRSGLGIVKASNIPTCIELSMPYISIR